MGFAFDIEEALNAYGNGLGQIIIETSDHNGKITGRVAISVERFEFLANEYKSLITEAWKGDKND